MWSYRDAKGLPLSVSEGRPAAALRIVAIARDVTCQMPNCDRLDDVVPNVNPSPGRDGAARSRPRGSPSPRRDRSAADPVAARNSTASRKVWRSPGEVPARREDGRAPQDACDREPARRGERADALRLGDAARRWPDPAGRCRPRARRSSRGTQSASARSRPRRSGCRWTGAPPPARRLSRRRAPRATRGRSPSTLRAKRSASRTLHVRGQSTMMPTSAERLPHSRARARRSHACPEARRAA